MASHRPYCCGSPTLRRSISYGIQIQLLEHAHGRCRLAFRFQDILHELHQRKLHRLRDQGVELREDFREWGRRTCGMNEDYHFSSMDDDNDVMKLTLAN